MAKVGVQQPATKGGNATIDKVGHTTTGQYGSNPDAKPVSRKSPRDLNLK